METLNKKIGVRDFICGYSWGWGDLFFFFPLHLFIYLFISVVFRLGYSVLVLILKLKILEKYLKIHWRFCSFHQLAMKLNWFRLLIYGLLFQTWLSLVIWTCFAFHVVFGTPKKWIMLLLFFFFSQRPNILKVA